MTRRDIHLKIFLYSKIRLCHSVSRKRTDPADPEREIVNAKTIESICPRKKRVREKTMLRIMNTDRIHIPKNGGSINFLRPRFAAHFICSMFMFPNLLIAQTIGGVGVDQAIRNIDPNSGLVVSIGGKTVNDVLNDNNANPNTVGSIISEITNLAINSDLPITARNVLITGQMAKLLDSIAGPEIAQLLPNNLAATLTSKTSSFLDDIPRAGKFPVAILASFLIDVIAENGMQAIIAQQEKLGKPAAYTYAAAWYVGVKQAGVIATSGGNTASIIVGQAVILNDVGSKVIDSGQEYNQVKALADRAKMRADLFEIYAVYYSKISSETDPINRKQLIVNMNADFQVLANSYGIPYRVSGPQAGALLEGGVAVSDMESLFYQLKDQFNFDIVTIQPAPPSNNYAPPWEHDLCKGTEELCDDAEPHTSNDDSHTDQNNHGNDDEINPKAEVTPSPVLTLTGFISGIDLYASPNLATHSTLNNATNHTIGDVTYVSYDVSKNCISGCAISNFEQIQGDYTSEYNNSEYLSWGRLGQRIELTNENAGSTTKLSDIRWIYGAETSPDYINSRVGNAYFSGKIYIDTAIGGTDFYSDQPGGITLSLDFSDNTLSGEGYFNLSDIRQEGFNIAGGLINSEGSQILQASLTGQQNTDNTGGLLGAFYGPEANEIGGAIWYSAGNTAIGGVIRAEASAIPPVQTFTQIYRGFANGYWGTKSNKSSTQERLTTSQLFTKNNAQDAFVNGQNEFSPNQSFHTSGKSGLVVETNISTRGTYSFTDWGTWNSRTNPVLDRNGVVADRGHWLIGANTHESQIPKSGTATYNGEAIGTDHTGASITGTAHLQAEFSADTIDARLDLKKNGSGWASINFAPMGITAPPDSSAISETHVFSGHVGNNDGAITGLPSSTDAFIGGAFYGDQAQEVGGYWVIRDITGPFTGAQGVFRAKQ